MILRHVTLVVILGISAAAISVAAQETEVGREEEARPENPDSECACPKAGRWMAKNLEGWMRCTGTVGFKRKLKKEGRNPGIIWILEEDCSKFFAEALEKKRDDVLMERVDGCGFQGTLWGEEEGVEVFMAINAKLESDEFMTGELFLNPEEDEEAENPEDSEDPEAGGGTRDRKIWKAGGGMEISCKGYRPWEFSFVEPLSEKEYPKLKKRMEKKLEEFHRKNRSGPTD